MYVPDHLRNADRYGGFVIGLIVIFMGFRVVRETALQLMDTMPEPAQMEALRAEALTVPGALGIDKCYARKTGLRLPCRSAPGSGSQSHRVGLARNRPGREASLEESPGLGCRCSGSCGATSLMMENREIARLLWETADLMEIAGEDGFRIRSYRNAASVIEGYPEPISAILKDPEKKVTDIPGIGKGIASALEEIEQRGQLRAS